MKVFEITYVESTGGFEKFKLSFINQSRFFGSWSDWFKKFSIMKLNSRPNKLLIVHKKIIRSANNTQILIKVKEINR